MVRRRVRWRNFRGEEDFWAIATGMAPEEASARRRRVIAALYGLR